MATPVGNGQTPNRGIFDPQYTPVPVLRGVLTWPCCGHTWKQESPYITQVVCPKCHTSYDILLQPRKPSPETYPRGTRLRLKANVQTALYKDLDGNLVSLQADLVYTSGSDPHSVLGSLEGQTLLEIPIAPEKDYFCLWPVSNDLLEEIPAEKLDAPAPES